MSNKSNQPGRVMNLKPAIAIQRLSPSSSKNIKVTKEVAQSPDIVSSTDSEIEQPELGKNSEIQIIAPE